MTFPNTVKAVLDGAFQGASLRSVVLDAGLETLGKCKGTCSYTCSGAFSQTQLRRVAFPSALRELGDRTFLGCKELRRATFTEGSMLEKIGRDCFACSGIEEFTAPRSLREIGQKAFANCAELQRVMLNEGLTRIGEGHDELGDYGQSYAPDEVFRESGLVEIALPSTLARLSKSAFMNCFQLRVVWVKKGLTLDVRKSARTYVSVLPLETTVRGRLLWDLRGLSEVVIPEDVEKVESEWFSGSAIESAVIPGLVREIGEKAFFDCKRLRRVEFAADSHLQLIGKSAFERSGITGMTVPRSVTVLGERAFKECWGLKRLDFQDGSALQTIGNWCFVQSGLEEITIPNSVVAIERAAFNVSQLKKLSLQEGSGLEMIGTECFSSTHIEEFCAPPGLREIENGAFAWCKELKRAVLNEGLETLGGGHGSPDGVFQHSGLESVVLPSTLKRIETKVFSDCENLKGVQLPQGLEYLGYRCLDGLGLEEFVAPPALREIRGTFYGCKRLKRVVLNEGIEVLKCAF